MDWRGGLDVGQEKKASRGPKCRGRRARLDVEQAGKQAEVQNAEEEEQDWTLDRVKSRQRSKMQRKKSKIGHWTG